MKKDVLFILLLGLFSQIKWVNNYKCKYLNKLGRKSKINLDIHRVKIRSFNCLEIEGIGIKNQDTIVKIERVLFVINLFECIRSRSFLKSLELRVISLSINSRRGSKVFEAGGVASHPNDLEHIELNKIYYSIYKRISGFFFGCIPKKVTIDRTRIFLNEHDILVIVSSLIYSKGTFVADIEYSFKSAHDILIARGEIDEIHHSIVISSLERKRKDIASKTFFSFENIYILFRQEHDKDNELHALKLVVEISNLQIDLKAICSNAFNLKSLSFEIDIRFGSETFIISDESKGCIEGMPFSIFFSHETKDGNTVQFIFNIDIDAQKLIDVFSAISMLSLENFEVDGNIIIGCRLIYRLNNPVEHFFELKVLKNNLSFNDFKDLNFEYLNKPFLHRVFKNDINLRSIVLDVDKNEDFCEIELLAPKLIDIIIYSEDPNFYDHSGVDVFFVGFAIVSNIAAKRFKRGASTITMQLARNLFLNHEKSIARKLEEIIIALLIENTFKVSKKRILEIYLNIIEFGPNIYGINEAAMFYFNKPQKELTIEQCIILSYIVPRPIHFYDALKSNSLQLKRNLGRHIERMTNGLLSNEIVSQSEFKMIEQSMGSEEDIFETYGLRM